MCGRFTLTSGPAALQRALHLDTPPEALLPRFNIAPTQEVAIVTSLEKPRVEYVRWGLIPSWAKEASIGSRLINARAETVREKPAFRSAFLKRRCLILADGFYEWERTARGRGGARAPFYIQMDSGEPFTFAGLWETWRAPEGQEVRTCTIVTCAANEIIGRFHDRMPVILEGEAARRWLEPSTSPDDLGGLLVPFPAERMRVRVVSSLVNSPGNDGPQVLQPGT
jgi:putative SOS response-associated peptidase YedK